MKRKDISIKWRIFNILVLFAIVLLGVLWFFQIVYLNDFYKIIKKKDAEILLSQVEEILWESDDISQEIEKTAASNNVAIYITDADGNSIYNAEYIYNSKMSSIPKNLFDDFYEQAKENGGRAVIEYEGSEMKGNHRPPVPPEFSQENLLSEDSRNEGIIPYTIEAHKDEIEEFRQNFGNDMAESVIYVDILDLNGSEVVVMLNSVLTPVDATVSTLKSQLTIISVIMIAIAIISSLVLSNSITKSIIKMNDGARLLAKGDYSVKFDSRDYKEVSQLSDTLNFAAKELEKTDNLQKELMANVSHDLRTPLTMIKGYAEVMRDIPGESTPENIQVIIDETERLSSLVNDMLDISKLKAKTITLNKQVYNITDSIRQVLQRYNKLQEQEGYLIEFECNEDVEVYADEQKMFQVLYNLINNAINYTSDTKRVVVRQKIVGDKLRFEVQDWGKGISAEDIPYIWDRYYKVDKAHKRAVKGTGLGLSIVKNILELHETCYGVNSREGEGATFWFELPLYSLEQKGEGE